MTVIEAVPFVTNVLAASTGPLVPGWMAMLWETPDVFGIAIVTVPAAAVALLVT